jgi:hypothetical protein
MKSIYFLLAVAITFTPMLTLASGDTTVSIAVTNPNVNLINSKPDVIAKMIRLELNKLNKFYVMDEFDMSDVVNSNEKFKTNCFGMSCLTELGKALKVNYIVGGSYDLLEQKIAISLKIIDVESGQVYKSAIREFDNQQGELQRMSEVMLREMFGLPVEKELIDRLTYKNEPITSNNVGTISNNGPRVGVACMVGSMYEFATRKSVYGGMDIFPVVSMIGYQEEIQYVGTEKFSALLEGIINISGLEQGKFIPSISILNGFRFGKRGWEFAFGPAFGIKRSSFGFVDVDNKFGNDQRYFSESDWNQYAYEEYADQSLYPQYFDQFGYFKTPTPAEVSNNPDYNFDKRHGDMNGSVGLNTMFVIAFGRTFRAGSLNLPVNVFYSSQRNGGMVGINVGFNVTTNKTNINN